LEYYAYAYDHYRSVENTTETIQQHYDITSIVAQTLPFQSFAITYAGLVLFYHGVVATLSTSFSNMGNMGAGTSSKELVGQHVGQESSSQQPLLHSSSQTQSNYNVHTQSSGSSSNGIIIQQQSSNLINSNIRHQKSQVPAHGKIHSRLKYIHRFGYGIYCFFIVMNCIIPILDSTTLQIILDVYFSIWFSVLSMTLIFFGGNVLLGLGKRMWNGTTGSILLMVTTNENTFVHASAKQLGLKMICLTFICSLGFFGRAYLGVISAWDKIHGTNRWDILCEQDQKLSKNWKQSFLFSLGCSSTFSASMIGYILLEWIPAITVIFVMKKRSNIHDRLQNQNENMNQFITRRPMTTDREAIIIGLEAGQGQALPRVGSHGGANHGLVDKSRSYSANIGSIATYSRGNIGPRSHASGVGGGNTMKRSNSGAATSETKALLGGHKSTIHAPVTSYGGL
jgi:hypothetical protein